nr:MGMT family protein [uncultured Campylobacter sp.]
MLYGSYPCHRVVSHSSALAASFTAQRELLEAEGVKFRGERARMKKHRWEC